MTAPRVLKLADPRYPTALRNLPQPPPILYAKGRLELLERPGIAACGCLVTEFPPGTPHSKYHSPQRNRIIAGLSRGVLVVDSPILEQCDLSLGEPGRFTAPTPVSLT